MREPSSTQAHLSWRRPSLGGAADHENPVDFAGFSWLSAWVIRHVMLERISGEMRVAKVVALLGPRQSGKTTLARQYCEQSSLPFDPGLNYFDLEDAAHLERLRNPMFALQSLRGLVVIDEIQLRPELFGVLRVLVDRPTNEAKFLILGSASRDLIRQGAETLAGRIGFVEVFPFGLAETDDVERLWIRGGFPLSYLAQTEADSWRWRGNYIKTFLERDIPALGIQIPPASLRRFWMMLAHYHGQTLTRRRLTKTSTPPIPPSDAISTS